ncbi:MAG: DUF2066 domain-containing protein [Pseudomonadales bacterium]
MPKLLTQIFKGLGGRILVPILVGLLSVVPGAGAEVVDWLYQVEVPVADQSPQSRAGAAEVALAEVLGRISGTSPLPDSVALRGALAAPERYYSQFRFLAATETAPLRLRFDFAPGITIELAKTLGLPVWWANRPRLVPWIVMADRVVTDNVDDAFASALLLRARQRGIPLVLPQADELGDAPLSAARVLRGNQAELALAAGAYEGEAIGVVRVTDRGGQYRSNWSVELPDGQLRFSASAADPAGLGSAAADALADRLAARFAASGGGGTLAIRLTGVESPTDFARLLDYMAGLEFVDAVQVTSIDADGMNLSVGSQAGAERFLELVEGDGQLTAGLVGETLLTEPGTLALRYRGGATQ